MALACDSDLLIWPINLTYQSGLLMSRDDTMRIHE
jgi:hypothetical protein